MSIYIKDETLGVIRQFAFPMGARAGVTIPGQARRRRGRGRRRRTRPSRPAATPGTMEAKKRQIISLVRSL